MPSPVPPEWLRFDFTGALADLPDLDPQTAELRRRHCLPPDALERLAEELESARQQVLEELILEHYGRKTGEQPPSEGPLDPGFIDLPDVLLEEYRGNGSQSELGRMKAAAGWLQENVDRVVLLGIGGSYMGSRALFEALCHPYHNQRTRGERGRVPRLYFAGNNLDNDRLFDLLDLINQPGASPESVDDRWAVVVVSKSGGTLETAAALRIVLRDAGHFYAGHEDLLKKVVVPVTGAKGKLRRLAEARGYEQVFTIPDDVGGRFSIFTPVGLLPAAVLGLDVVRLLEGAAAMNRRFREQPVGQNPVLDYAGVAHLLERDRGATVRVLATWSAALEAVGFWYDQLLSESLGKQERGATPITAVNTRDLHSRGQQHQEGRRDKLITNLLVAECRRTPVQLGHSDGDEDDLNRFEKAEIPDLLEAAVRGTNRAYRDAARPTADIVLPWLDEFSLGQLFQMLMLATVVEGRLVGINPYGQPGVEAYKKNMMAILEAQRTGK